MTAVFGIACCMMDGDDGIQRAIMIIVWLMEKMISDTRIQHDDT
jgi:hypothetical protein